MMIKIEIDDQIRTEIENLHREWFLKKVKTIIKLPRRKISRKKYLSEILKLDENDFENEISPYILGQLDDIKKIISKNTILKGIAKKKNLTKDEKKIKKRTDLIIEAFGYNDFDNRNKTTWGAYKLCEHLKVHVCPYCNRQYTFTIRDEEQDCISRPEMDHFFSKSIYPFLSINLYNLIPSCHICNHIKSDRDNQIIYPYAEEFGKDIVFRAKYKQSDFSQNSSIIDISNVYVFFKNQKSNVLETGKCIHNKQVKAKHSIETFNLEHIYNEHKIELKDLLTRYRNYSKPKIDEITKLIANAQLSTQASDDTVNQVAKIYTKRIKRTILGLPLGAGDKQYPLRKFKEDIIEQLDNTRQKMKDEAKSNK